MDQEPLVSIVTPCLNAERFIARTIESVVAQDYQHIEYIVMDGGSTDSTLSVLQRYGERVRFASAPDRGAADAINRGFSTSCGSILAWLNADDTYLPGAVSAAVRAFLSSPESDVVYGEAFWVDEQDHELGRYPTSAPYRPEMLERECCICQPAAFFRRQAYEAAKLDINLRCAFDYDFWIRLSRGHRFLAVPDRLAKSRMHRASITLGSRKRVFQENVAVLRRHYGYVPVSWIYGYLSYLRDGRDQYFEPMRHSGMVYLGALVAGLYYNFRHPWRFVREWISAFEPGKLRRALRGELPGRSI